MSKEFVKQMCKMAPNYEVKLEVCYNTVRLQIRSLKKPGLVKTSVFRFSDLSEHEELNQFFQDELDELFEVVQQEESR